MDEKDKAIQDLRRENERLRKWVDELEDKDKAKHGHWERLYGRNYKCSVCGAWYEADEEEILDFDYCPNCGAKMDEDKPTFRKLRMVEPTDKAVVLKKDNTDGEVTE